jgi:hypothetical protein
LKSGGGIRDLSNRTSPEPETIVGSQVMDLVSEKLNKAKTARSIKQAVPSCNIDRVQNIFKRVTVV